MKKIIIVSRNKYFCLITIIALLIFGCKKEVTFRTYEKPQVIIRQDDPRLANRFIILKCDTVYVLATNLIINSGGILKIEAGTLIKVNDGFAITINAGGRIEAKGTATNPIVFTSAAGKGSPGFIGYQNNDGEHSWLGIAIYGNYPNPIDDTPAGTGILSYVRIEFAGRSYELDNFQSLPSLLLQNVGKGTVIENIEASYSVTFTSFEISGGDFNASNLISFSSGSSDFHFKDGYTGMMQNLLAYRHPFFSPALTSSTTLAGLLISGENTFPSISNLTVLGPDTQAGINPKYYDTTRPGIFGQVDGSRVGACIVTGGQFHIRNSVFMGFPKGGVYLDNNSSAISLQSGTSDFDYNIVHSNDAKRSFYISPELFPPYTSEDFKTYMLQPQFGNEIFSDGSQCKFADPYNFDINPNPLLAAGSPLLSGANFDAPFFNDLFFKKVNYRGGIGTENWLQGWTNFIPLQTNYNN